MDEVFFTPELLHARAEHSDSWSEDESCLLINRDFLIFWEDFPGWVDIGNRKRLHDEKLGTETDIVACWLESANIKIRNSDISGLDSGLDVAIGEIHTI